MALEKNLLKIIEHFLHLQVQLMEEFKDNHKYLKDWEFISDFPKKGSITLNDELWMFNKHGAGMKFINKLTGQVVDIDRNITSPNIFYAWRLKLYLESIKNNTSINDLKIALNELLKKNQLEESHVAVGYFSIQNQKETNLALVS